ncbi:MAG: cupredoxin domain-containing protein [Chloroflexota bacterium]
MLRSDPRLHEMETFSQVVRAVERKLGVALLVLALGIAGILALSFGQPAFQYLAGGESHFSAAAEGAGCGSHLEWRSDTATLESGSRVRFTNDAGYWQVPVAIDRQETDGSWTRVAESSKLREGESWSHTFWQDGVYRLTSSEDVLRYAGLDTEIVVE